MHECAYSKRSLTADTIPSKDTNVDTLVTILSINAGVDGGNIADPFSFSDSEV